MGLAGRLPARLEDLHGPERGVIVLPRHLAWPGMREFDVADDQLRRSMYGIVLTQGRRNDLARFVNARLLRQDWPVLRSSLDPKLRRWCERRLALRGMAAPGADTTGSTGTTGSTWTMGGTGSARPEPDAGHLEPGAR